MSGYNCCHPQSRTYQEEVRVFFLFKMCEGEDQDIVELLSILQLIERVTNIMNTSEHATVSLILPLKNTILRHCECEPLADDSSTISAMKQAVVDDLSQRYATPAMKVIIILFFCIELFFAEHNLLPYRNENKAEKNVFGNKIPCFDEAVQLNSSLTMTDINHTFFEIVDVIICYTLFLYNLMFSF